MPTSIRYKEIIWPSIHAAVPHLQQERKTGLSAAIRAGLNFCIILGSACYLEGVLESGLKALLAHRRVNYRRLTGKRKELFPMNWFYSRIEEDLEKRVCRATGSEGYDPLFELLTGTRLSKLPRMEPLWEGVTVLFQMRNVLGHGREVAAEHYSAHSEAPFEELFSGGYSVAENYLRKKKLLASKFTQAKSNYIFLADPIADHFWNLATQAPKAIARSLDSRERRAFEKVAFLK
jgi:hypothetical protein